MYLVFIYIPVIYLVISKYNKCNYYPTMTIWYYLIRKQSISYNNGLRYYGQSNTLNVQYYLISHFVELHA